jgi:hypothetical protein
MVDDSPSRETGVARNGGFPPARTNAKAGRFLGWQNGAPNRQGRSALNPFSLEHSEKWMAEIVAKGWWVKVAAL